MSSNDYNDNDDNKNYDYNYDNINLSNRDKYIHPVRAILIYQDKHP